MSDMAAVRVSDPERLRRWRMVLGGAEDTGEGADAAGGVTAVQLDGNDMRVDAALAAVYDAKPRARGGGGRSGGLGSSAPSVARWLGDIRRSVTKLDKAKRLLAFQPKVALRDGLEQTLAWVRAQAAA